MKKIICCIYDELSAVSCLETIRQGFDVKIIVCYQKESDLLNLVKIINRIIQRTLKSKIELEFFKVTNNGSSARSYLLLVETIVEILLDVAGKGKFNRISLPVSPLIFPQSFIDKITNRISQKNIISHISLSGIDENILECAKEIGLEKYLPQIEKLGRMKFDVYSKGTDNSRKIVQQALGTKKVVTITLGPNNVHDIIDSLKSDH